MSEQPINPSESKKQGRTDQEEQRVVNESSTHPAWQPLEPKSTPEEDLASILQAGIKGEISIEDDDIFSSERSAQFSFCETDPHQDQANNLAALAATVFDTTFYLVPRSNQHFLLGDLSEYLHTWMPGVCEIYSWELGLLSIRPDYLKWTLLDFPECLIRRMLAVVRQWTSKQIFEHFPALFTHHTDPDFWAPGYLVDTQNRDFPTQVLIANVSRERSV